MYEILKNTARVSGQSVEVDVLLTLEDGSTETKVLTLFQPSEDSDYIRQSAQNLFECRQRELDLPSKNQRVVDLIKSM